MLFMRVQILRLGALSALSVASFASRCSRSRAVFAASTLRPARLASEICPATLSLASRFLKKSELAVSHDLSLTIPLLSCRRQRYTAPATSPYRCHRAGYFLSSGCIPAAAGLLPANWVSMSAASLS
jgi:hypothetical protein